MYKLFSSTKIIVAIVVSLILIASCAGYFIHQHNIEQERLREKQELENLVNEHYEKVNSMMKLDAETITGRKK